jgi:uncharacterized protein (TIGR00730 family)
MKTTVAYQNQEFLTSEDARSVRILCEYLEPRARLARLQVVRAVIFFGSARVRPGATRGPDYYAQAADLAERLARWTHERHPPAVRYYLCTGGGPGIMQAVHEGAARVDRTLNLGFNISLPHEQHVNEFVTRERAFEFHYFFMRKLWFASLAQAFVAFPGGFGTLDELFEMLNLTQTGKAQVKPILLFGGEFWRKAVDFSELLARGYIAAEDLRLIQTVDSVEEAYAVLTAALEAKNGATAGA